MLPAVWAAPSGLDIKINVDGSYNASGKAGVGVVLRDYTGKLLDCFAYKVDASSSLMAEAIALKKGLQIAMSLELSNCCFEFDCLSLVNSICCSFVCTDWRCAPIVDDIKFLASSSFGFSLCWISRDANLAADWLAKHVDTRMGPSGWVSNPPSLFLFVIARDASSAKDGVG